LSSELKELMKPAPIDPELQARLDRLREARERIERKIEGQNTDALSPVGPLPPSNAGNFGEGPDAARFFNGLNSVGSNVVGGTVVNVNVSGSVSTERDLVAAITQGIYAQQASGIPINYSTVY
jgi:hypothetical protein